MRIFMSRNYALYRFPKERFGCYITVFIAWYFHLGRCSNTYRLHHLQRSKLNFGPLRVVEMSQRADTGDTGASNQEKTTAFESSTQVKFASECSERMFGRHNGGQYCNCKRYSSLTRVPALSSQRYRKSDVTLISLLRKAVRPVQRMTSHQFSTTNADCTDLKKKRAERTIPGG